jgi:hypothetical protein
MEWLDTTALGPSPTFSDLSREACAAGRLKTEAHQIRNGSNNRCKNQMLAQVQG